MAYIIQHTYGIALSLSGSQPISSHEQSARDTALLYPSHKMQHSFQT